MLVLIFYYFVFHKEVSKVMNKITLSQISETITSVFLLFYEKKINNLYKVFKKKLKLLRHIFLRKKIISLSIKTYFIVTMIKT